MLPGASSANTAASASAWPWRPRQGPSIRAALGFPTSPSSPAAPSCSPSRRCAWSAGSGPCARARKPTALFRFGGLLAITTLLIAGGGDWSALGVVPSTIWDSVTNFTLTAVPLYILMGAIIAASGMGAESVGKLFLAGILPSLLLALLFTAYQMWLARRRFVSAAQPVRAGPVSMSDHMRALVEILPVATLIAIILGSVYSGIATPTETAAIGVAVSLLLASVLYRELDWQKCRLILMETGRGSIMVMTIIAGAMVFGYALTTTDIAPTLSRVMARVDLPQWLVFIAINLLLLFPGCLLETLSIIVITTPIIIPIIDTFGWDKVWFGVILMINMEMALITPPVGLNLFVVKGVVPEVPLGRIISGTLPYVAIMALALALVAVFPQLGLYPHRSPDGMVVGFKSPRSANVYLGQNLPDHDGNGVHGFRARHFVAPRNDEGASVKTRPLAHARVGA